MISEYTYQQYADDVLAGRVEVGEYVRLAIERNERDKETESQYYFDSDKAEKYINFIQKCRHWKGEWAGTYIHLEPWQQFYIACLFGWMREDGSRRFRTVYMQVARKNTKTTLCATKSLAHLYIDREPGAQVYFAATKEDQARIGFKDVQEIIRATPGLPDMFRIFTKSVVFENSFIKPLGSDSNTSDGFDPSYGVIDEYHAHPNDGMLNVLESGMGARRSPLIDVITTAGYNKDGPCYTTMRNTAIQVLKGIKTDETLLALIYEPDPDDDWQDESMWVKSNPNLGVSVRLDFLRDRFLKAKNEGGSKQVDFKTKNLNIWTDSARTWIPDDVWMEGDRGQLPDLTGRVCYAGLDLASTTDWNAFVMVFPDDDLIHVLPHFWIPRGKIDRNPERVDYARFIQSGHLTVIDGDIADHAYIAHDIEQFSLKYQIKGIAFDRFMVYAGLIQHLRDVRLPLHEFGQGFVSMSAPTKEMESLVLQRKLNHAGDAVLRWMCSNIMIRTDPAGNIKIDKDKSTEKVDGMVALVMAIGELMSLGRNIGSVYNDPNYQFTTI